MPIDSTADLLFRIGANTDDAESNVQRFRALLGTDLSVMAGEFDDWSAKIFGDLTTVKGAMIGLGAGLAAAVVAAAGAAVEAGRKYSEFVDEVARGSRVTGISAENMSRLKFAAEATHVSYDALVTGLARFTHTIVAATGDWEHHGEAFRKLGITQEQVKAGEQDLMPLLLLVMDRFKALGSRVLQTAEARDLFSRGGPAMVAMLSQGSEAMREMFAEADKLGVVIGAKDVEANEQYKLSLHLLKTEIQAMAVMVGREVLPILTSVAAHIIGFIEAEKEMFNTQANIGDYITLGMGTWIKAFQLSGEKADEFKAKMQALAASLSKFGEGGGEGLGGSAKEAQDEWTGLADALRKVRDATIDTASVDERTRKEYGDLQVELDKTTKKFEELKKAGKLSAEDIAESQKALAAMPAALSALLGRYIQEIADKNKQAGEDLQRQILGQGQQTMAVRVALWDQEIAKLREKLTKEKSDTAENLALLAALEKAGWDKIGAEAAEGVQKAGEAIDKQIAAQGEQSYAEKREQWNREIDGQADTLAREQKLTDENLAKLAALRKAGLEKIDRDEKAAGDAAVARLGEQLQRIEGVHETAAQRIAAQYQADVAKYLAAEEKKSLAAAVGEAQRAQITAMYTAIRKGLFDKEQADLQQLQNSQGWQGVFGSKFAEAIRGNEALSKEWATSQQQAHMMVRVSLESLKESGQQAFGQMAEGMGSAIAQSLVYSKSLGDAMRQALAQTLESISARAMVQAIYSAALGFLCLAEGDFSGAASAFEAAAIFGSVGVAAGVAGRAAAGSQSQAGGAGAAGRGGSGSGPGVGQYGSQTAARQADEMGVAAPGSGPGGPHMTVNFYGHVLGTSGASEVCSMLSDAVMNSNATLTATNTKTGKQVTQ